MANEIEMLDFQSALVNSALAPGRKWFSAELATGIGKTIIAARIAAACIQDGPVVYVCPSPTSIGTVEQGVINKFVRVFAALGLPTIGIGRCNELSRANDVSFVTPTVLARKLHTRLDGMSCMIVDEAHHFASDKEALKIYSEVYATAKSCSARVISLTGTWGRLDRRVIMGQVQPDARLSVQDAVDLGRCPEIYGIQVIMDIVAKGAKRSGDWYDYHLQGPARKKYYDGVAECIAEVYVAHPTPFAAFVRSQQDAREITARVNKILEAKYGATVVLLSTTTKAKRHSAIQDILEKRCPGYITCGVGEESLDVPPIGVVHLIRRTRSIVRNAQAIGRALRLHPEKRRALVVDYQLPVAACGFVGLNVDDMVVQTGSRTTRVVNGGPIVTRKQIPESPELQGITMEEERALVLNSGTIGGFPRNAISDEYIRAQEKHARDKPKRLKTFADLALGFRLGMLHAHRMITPDEILPVHVVTVKTAFSDADLELNYAWWKTSEISHQTNSVIPNELRRASSWREFCYHRQPALIYGKAAAHTLSMLAQCYLRRVHPDPPGAPTWGTGESSLYVADAPIAVVSAAILAAINRRSVIRGKAWGAIHEVLDAAGFSGWHHTQTDTLPAQIHHFDNVLCMDDIHRMGEACGLVWLAICAKYRPVIISASEDLCAIGPNRNRNTEAKS